jgi:hypothetical protein
MRFARLLLLTATLGVAFGEGVVAQQEPATVSGRLVDPNGNAVTGLERTSLALTNVETGETLEGPISQQTGEFTVNGVRPGTYDIRAPIICCLYSSVDQKGVRIEPGQRIDVPVQWGMNLGTIGDDPGILGNDMRARAGVQTGSTPRMADGKPDISGVWSFVRRAAGTGGPFGPPIQMKPWAAEIQKQLRDLGVDPNAAAYCLPQSAIPTTLTYPQKFVQTASVIVQLTDFYTPGYRQIFLDGRGHPEYWNPSWLGHSVGTWDGDTLVIETVGFNEITPFGFGIHSEKLRVVERIRRPDYGRLEIEIYAEDPEAWEAPYTTTLEAALLPDEEILEWVCPENNTDPLHFGGLGWRGRP